MLSEEIAAAPVRFAELQAGRPILGERRLQRKDGSVFVAEISGKKLADGRYQGIVRDISERKRMQETLRQSEEKYRNLFNNAEVACSGPGSTDPRFSTSTTSTWRSLDARAMRCWAARQSFTGPTRPSAQLWWRS